MSSAKEGGGGILQAEHWKMGDQQKADKRCRWCVEGESVLKNHKIQTNPIELKKTVVTQNWLKGGG